jgi:hypothetical protein
LRINNRGGGFVVIRVPPTGEKQAMVWLGSDIKDTDEKPAPRIKLEIAGVQRDNADGWPGSTLARVLVPELRASHQTSRKSLLFQSNFDVSCPS